MPERLRHWGSRPKTSAADRTPSGHGEPALELATRIAAKRTISAFLQPLHRDDEFHLARHVEPVVALQLSKTNLPN